MKVYNLESLREKIKADIKSALTEKGMLDRHVLFIQPDDDPRAASYIKSKEKLLESIGLRSETLPISMTGATPDTINEVIVPYVQEAIIHNVPILVQLPMPGFSLDKFSQITAKLPSGEIRGVGSIDIDRLCNQALLEQAGGKAYDYMLPCTVQGIVHIINQYLFDSVNTKWNKRTLAGCTILVIGRGELVGRPLSRLLQDAGATVLTASSGTQPGQIRDMCAMSDIVISAAGCHGVIKSSYFDEMQNVLIIDAGVSFIDGKLHSDFEILACDQSLNSSHPFLKFTPRIGGVGPMTVLSVGENAAKILEANGGQSENLSIMEIYKNKGMLLNKEDK